MRGEKTLSQNCFKQWEVETYVDKTISDNRLKLEHHAGLKNLSRWITKTRGSEYSFALSAH